MQEPTLYACVIEVTKARHLFNPAHQTSNASPLALWVKHFHKVTNSRMASVIISFHGLYQLQQSYSKQSWTGSSSDQRAAQALAIQHEHMARLYHSPDGSRKDPQHHRTHRSVVLWD
tara:strand:+ start:3332 stop:3682 length:351 start_codon:yes stop_codon:yes gene_type:complete